MLYYAQYQSKLYRMEPVCVILYGIIIDEYICMFNLVGQYENGKVLYLVLDKSVLDFIMV